MKCWRLPIGTKTFEVFTKTKKGAMKRFRKIAADIGVELGEVEPTHIGEWDHGRLVIFPQFRGQVLVDR